ncbi:hypothetical protein HMI54_009916 [Coelomomyces lativittatus]|nr:hypothetical protein HMI56_002999 [Coelomomyces lativittatus]KAJ1516316.1 hypothetical protein HMI54_009916 [Coelomomyces lativittatus]
MASKLLEIPLIITEHVPTVFGPTVHELKEKIHSVPSSSSSSKAPPPSFQIFSKSKFSMCTSEVMETINQSKRDQLVIFGIESHVCISQTVLELLEHSSSLSPSFDVYVLADGVSSIQPFEVPIALNRLSQAGAIVTTSESILFHLLQDATHPQFKSISQLIKEFKLIKSPPLSTTV